MRTSLLRPLFLLWKRPPGPRAAGPAFPFSVVAPGPWGLSPLVGAALFACTTPNDHLSGGGDASALSGPDAGVDSADGSGGDSTHPPGPDAALSPASDAAPGADGARDAAAPPGPEAGSDAGPGPDSGPHISFYIRTSTEPVPHADGLSGQTAREAFQGVGSFALLRDADDPNPLVVLDLGAALVEAGYNDGDETFVGSCPLAGLHPGHYTLGRNLVTHSRYRVNAVMHVGGLPVPGEFDNVQVLTEGTVIDGVARPQSWFRYVFRVGATGAEYPLEGTGAPLPTDPTTGGFRLVLEDGQAFYDYPLDLTLAAVPDADLRVVLQVNMDRSFRWTDEALPGYLPGVFDSTPAESEVVRRFGANSLTIRVE